ncbi:MAG: hypothetical protein OER93_04005 [Thermoleophilia bacterium]|nr:hypothetical protein [Thermoleophilia bacterium]
MANHLTIDELSSLLGLRERDIVRICQKEAIPIYQGRVDKMLFVRSLRAGGYHLSEPAQGMLAAS